MKIMSNDEDSSITVGWLRFNGAFDTDLVTSRHYRTDIYIHTHTHPFNGPFSGTTPVSRYHSVFYRQDALPDAQPTASKH